MNLTTCCLAFPLLPSKGENLGITFPSGYCILAIGEGCRGLRSKFRIEGEGFWLISCCSKLLTCSFNRSAVIMGSEANRTIGCGVEVTLVEAEIGAEAPAYAGETTGGLGSTVQRPQTPFPRF
ncbi:hypothetical protein Acr_13g0004960 [Actinidia rufa]|uniref:Uncharacterized protein n=1 Tax=Actinidia rufa TaxID=165716 RepID=A0A7J0FK69_9ERIC|nr:hypothetical protein Acr_13g0004960 [Actinidia rufa]